MHVEQKHEMQKEQKILYNHIQSMYLVELIEKKIFRIFCKKNKCFIFSTKKKIFFNKREHSIFALTLDNDDTLYALAAFYDYPNIHGVPSNDWEEKWWKNSYGKTDE